MPTTPASPARGRGGAWSAYRRFSTPGPAASAAASSDGDAVAEAVPRTGGEAVDRMIDLLHAFADDPSSVEVGGDGGGGGGSGGGGGGGGGGNFGRPQRRRKGGRKQGPTADAYEAYASASPGRRRQRFLRNHAALMAELSRLAAASASASASGVGSNCPLDGRFLLWVGALLRDCGDGEDRGRMAQALEGIAAAVREVLVRPAPLEEMPDSKGGDGPYPGLGGGGGGGGMLGLLLAPAASAPANANANASSSSPTFGDGEFRTYLAAPSRIAEALARSRAVAAATDSQGGSGPGKRRKTSAGWRAGAGRASWRGPGAGGYLAQSDPVATALMGYILCHYLTSDHCRFPNPDASASPDDPDGDGSPSCYAPSWGLVRACCATATATMGMTAVLPSVRAGMACFALDVLGGSHEEGGGGVCGGDTHGLEGLGPAEVVDLLVGNDG